MGLNWVYKLASSQVESGYLPKLLRPDFPEINIKRLSGTMHWASWITLAVVGPALGCYNPRDEYRSTTSSSMTAQSLLARGIEALGGSEKMSKVTSLTYVGGEYVFLSFLVAMKCGLWLTTDLEFIGRGRC